MFAVVAGMSWGCLGRTSKRGLHRDNGNEYGSYRDPRGYVGLYRDYIGIVKKKMGAPMLGLGAECWR